MIQIFMMPEESAVRAGQNSSNLRLRVEQAAEQILARAGSVGPLDLFQVLGWLSPAHVEAWRRGDKNYLVLELWIQVGPDKLQKSLSYLGVTSCWGKAWNGWMRGRRRARLLTGCGRRGWQ
jgi:hypothetical protein